jgi:TPR repeat protein
VSGDLQAARLLLGRAARAHDARAALLMARSYDLVGSRHTGAGNAGADLEQARSWYQKAREWGSPEAQRQLDALAGYR